MPGNQEAGKGSPEGDRRPLDTGPLGDWHCWQSRQTLVAPILPFSALLPLPYVRLHYSLFGVESFVVFIVSLFESSISPLFSRMRLASHVSYFVCSCNFVFRHQRRWMSARFLLLLCSPTLRVLLWSNAVYFYHQRKQETEAAHVSSQTIPYPPHFSCFFLFAFVLLLPRSLLLSALFGQCFRSPPSSSCLHFPLSRFPLI